MINWTGLGNWIGSGIAAGLAAGVAIYLTGGSGTSALTGAFTAGVIAMGQHLRDHPFAG